MGIDVDWVVHVLPPRYERLHGGDVDGRVREDALRVERDHLDLWPGLCECGELVEDREARLREWENAQVSRRQLDRVCPISHVPCTSCGPRSSPKISVSVIATDTQHADADACAA